MFIVFDLDGTLADDEHRVVHLRKEKPDYETYFKLCPEDTPIKPVVRLLQDLFYTDDHEIEIWTGRPDYLEEQTIEWLMEHVFIWSEYMEDNINIRMRKADDYRPTETVKGEWLEESRERGHQPDLMFDDRNKMVDFWRAQGIVCLHVQERDY